MLLQNGVLLVLWLRKVCLSVGLLLVVDALWAVKLLHHLEVSLLLLCLWLLRHISFVDQRLHHGLVDGGRLVGEVERFSTQSKVTHHGGVGG